ncbi:MAG: FHA domain-containing protein [Myxococcales bacterium]|nr:FHA domain-containing protein [Myxococcales bacterium]
MSSELGVTCGQCDTFSLLGVRGCPQCGNPLAVGQPKTRGDGDPPMTERTLTPLEAAIPDARGEEDPPTDRGARLFEEPLKLRRGDPVRFLTPAAASQTHHYGRADLLAEDASSPKLSLEELMDQAKNFVCRSCSTPVPMGHKFCGRCGAAVPPEIMGARTQFFGQLQTPGRAKLILIRGEGVEGLSYHLNAESHSVGRRGELVFADDPFVSPKHANFFYRDGKLVVRDEGSLNGVYIRVRGSVELVPGDLFLAGEQVFRLEGPPVETDGPAPDGTYFYSSPKHGIHFRVTQILHGGAAGATVCARTHSLQIGREGGELNFPVDLYMSGNHCKIEESNGRYTLSDPSSRNGTFVRVKNEQELEHGDYVFIGRKLLRVEITAA